MVFASEEEWKAAHESAKDELALAYTQGQIDVSDPVDKTLDDLASRVARRVITSTHTA